MVKYTGRGLVVKRPGVLSKVQMLTLVLGVGVFSRLRRTKAKNGDSSDLPSRLRFWGLCLRRKQLKKKILAISVWHARTCLNGLPVWLFPWALKFSNRPYSNSRQKCVQDKPLPIERTKIAQSQSLTTGSALTEPNRQKSRRKKRFSDLEIAARNRKSLATFHRTLKSQCSIAFSCLGNRCDFWGPRWASQSQIANIAVISVR